MLAGMSPDAAPRAPKIPQSVLVVIHTPGRQVLLLEHADKPGYWQSVTGSKDHTDEPFAQTCVREVAEETEHRSFLISISTPPRR
jgi:dATP pyrophosphohydrolase